jgi:hypothetical protein
MKLQEQINKKYESLTKKMNEIIGFNDYIIENKINKNNEYVMDVYTSKNNKKLMLVKCEIIGFYNKGCNIFYWGDLFIPINIYANKSFKKIKKSKNKIKNMIINKEYEDIQYLEKLLYYISNNMFFIDELDINDLTRYICYKTKSIGILSHNDEINKKHYKIYYLVKEIIQM